MNTHDGTVIINQSIIQLLIMLPHNQNRNHTRHDCNCNHREHSIPASHRQEPSHQWHMLISHIEYIIHTGHTITSNPESISVHNHRQRGR